jgi:C4-dicarboxylate transporter DctQ subunit
MRRFWIVFDKIIEFMAALAALIMVFITFAVCRDVVMRYFFARPSIWVVQTCEYALLWMVFLATTWLLREGGHVSVDILFARLKGKPKFILSIIMYSIGGLACLLLTIFATQYTYESIVEHITDVRAVTVPMYSVFIIIPIGSAFLVIQFFRMVWNELHTIRKKESL